MFLRSVRATYFKPRLYGIMTISEFPHRPFTIVLFIRAPVRLEYSKQLEFVPFSLDCDNSLGLLERAQSNCPHKIARSLDLNVSTPIEQEMGHESIPPRNIIDALQLPPLPSLSREYLPVRR